MTKDIIEVDKIINSHSKKTIIDYVDKSDISSLSAKINIYTLQKEQDLKKDNKVLKSFIYLVSTLLFRAQLIVGGNQKIKFTEKFYKILDLLIKEAYQSQDRVYS